MGGVLLGDQRVKHAVVVDTNVFSAPLRATSPLADLYRRHLVGQRLVIATQTLAELRYGVLRAGWGERRLEQLARLVGASLVLAPDNETAWTYARLRVSCEREGHPLHQPEHAGDLWIAATAVRHDLPLVAHDRIFLEAPELDLRTELVRN
jgi:predicted nucleic acid-binding protein